MPEISVLLPTFNRSGMLVVALDSVLAQRDVDFEIIVSDNCSTDGTESVVEKYLCDSRVRYFRNESNIGMVPNWRRALYEHASSELFIIVSDDDCLTDPLYLSKAVHIMRDNSVKYVYAGGVIHNPIADSSVTFIPPFSGMVDGLSVFVSRGTIHPQDMLLCNMVFRKSDAQRLGFLNEDYNIYCDSEFYLTLSLEGKVYALKEKVCVYTKHVSNLSKNVRSDHRYLDKNLNCLVAPYLRAIQLGIAPEHLHVFRINSGFDRVISNTLILLNINNPDWYYSCRNRLQQLIRVELAEIEKSLRHRFLMKVLTIFGPISKRIFRVAS